jgi:hypothetical protein
MCAVKVECLQNYEKRSQNCVAGCALGCHISAAEQAPDGGVGLKPNESVFAYIYVPRSKKDVQREENR